MAINNLYPSERPTLNLNFSNSRTLDKRITFTRTTKGTYVDRDGLIKTAVADEPRFHHQYVNGQVESLGLLIEETSTNKFSQSIISNWGNPANGTKTANAGLSPDNTSTATLIEATSLNGQTRIENGGERTPGSTYTLSCFCKAGTTDYCTLGLYELTDGAKNFQAIFYLTGEGTVTFESNCTATISAYTNGWYRCTMTITLTAGASYSGSSWKLGVCNSPTAYYNADIGDNIYFWGAQLESKAFATSYMPSPLDGQQGSRGADRAYITGPGFSEWYNPDEGTIFARAKSFAASPELTAVLALNKPTDFGTNRVDLRYNQGGNSYIGFNSPPGLALSRTSGFSFSHPRFIVGYKTNIQKFAVNGSLASGTQGFVPSQNITHLQIGTFDNFSYELNGCISQLTYYPMLLSDTQLQTLTK